MCKCVYDLFKHRLHMMFLFLVERQDERITEMKREYHSLHERHSEVGDKCSLSSTRVILRDLCTCKFTCC